MSLYRKVLEKMKNITGIRKESGSILVLTALLLPIMFGCLGIAYDVGNIYMHKARLQNVADAAALAGGRAFLLSQAKAEGPDEIDANTETDKSATYELGKSPIHNYTELKHQDANNAADAYIVNNIINLGNTVYADKYSHYALRSGGENPKTFYRIGLSETVPLYFLPVITNKKSQIVRAGAIALVQPGTSGGGGGGVIVKTTNPSIFDNLFTVSQSFDANRSNENHNAMKASFVGNMVYTYGDGQGTNANENYFYKTKFGDSSSTDHLYETKDTSNYSNNSRVNDPTINTFYNIEAYVKAFKDKLDRANVAHHVGPNLNEWKSVCTPANINNTESDLYKSEVFVPSWDGGYRVWLGTNKKTPYINENGKYYAFDSSNDDYVYSSYGGSNYKVFYKNDGAYITVNGNDIQLQSNDISALNLSETDKAYVQNVNGENFDPQDNTRKYRKKVLGNVFHFDNGNGGVDLELKGKINTILPSDTDDTPVFIIITNISEVLNIKVWNTVRPVIIVYLGTGNVSFDAGSSSDVFKGAIYAPYANYVGMNFTGTFYGSVITKKLEIPYGGNGQGTAQGTWIQKNYLENYEYDNDGKITKLYEDSDIKPISNNIQNAITNAKDDPIVKAQLKSVYESMLSSAGLDLKGISSDDMLNGTDTSKAWYKDLSYNDKQTLYKAWKTAYNNSSSPLRDLLWTWGNGLSVEAGDGSTSDETPETLRLINFRTEYTNGDTIDPFINLSL